MYEIDHFARSLRDRVLTHDLSDTGIGVHFATKALDVRFGSISRSNFSTPSFEGRFLSIASPPLKNDVLAQFFGGVKNTEDRVRDLRLSFPCLGPINVLVG